MGTTMVEFFARRILFNLLRSGRIFPLLGLLLTGASPLSIGRGFAQARLQLVQPASTNPVLHHRSESEEIEAMDTVSRGRTTLSPDVSGEYSLGGLGESIEIDLQPDRLSGYIARSGDSESDEGASLTFFFATSSLKGSQLSFTTRQVHGVWFSFTGTIVRGAAQSRAQDGYYRLEGQLVRHDVFNKTDQARNVSLPLTRQYTNG